MKDILIIGYFGYRTNQLDGQTIKTREIAAMLNHRHNGSVTFFDTETLKYRKLEMIKLLWLIIKSKTIVYLPGQNNLQKFFKILYFISSIMSKTIIYIVVGGWLADFIADKQGIARRLKNIKAILVETNALKNNLENRYNFNNVTLFPNFRSHPFCPKIISNDLFRIVFMGRIIPEKGCNMILDFAKYYSSQQNGKRDIEIDFYGQIADKYKMEFMCRVEQCDLANYRGVIEYDKACEVMSKYDVCVLPTYYSGEGCPGTIIDAYRAGIPVIASKWKDIPEFIEEGRTGYTFDLKDVGSFYNHIIYLKNNPDVLLGMKKNAYHKSFDYSESFAWEILQPLLKY